MEIRPASDRSLLVSFGERISPETHALVRRMTHLAQALPGVRNVHPAYATVLIVADPLNLPQIESSLRAAKLDDVPLPEPRRVEIPVHYDGPDLDDVVRINGLTRDEVVAIHSGAEYLVYFLGFAPGFPYLGGMSEAIATPRLASPRKLVPAGSVAIGGSQTGIYPMASPGGWRLIGRTPLELFRADRRPPALLEMGDRVRFVPL